MEEVNYRFEEKNKTKYQRLNKFNAFEISWFWKMIIEIIGEGYKWFIENSYRQKSQKPLFQLQIKLLQQKNIKTKTTVHFEKFVEK